MSDGGTASPLDVLFVSSWFPWYEDPASGRFVADQVEALAATGAARPHVVTFDRSQLSGGASSRRRQEAAIAAASTTAITSADPLFVESAWGVRDDIPVARLSIPEGQTSRTRAVHQAAHREAAVDALAGRILAGETDRPGTGVVHAQGGYPDGAAAMLLADRLGWPMLITEHSSFLDRVLAVPAQRDRYAAALTRAHRLIAVSEMLAAELRAAFPDHAGRIVVVPNAVPIDRFEAHPLESRVAGQLLFVGYRKPSKGIENLLRAVAIARTTRPDITLRLLGGGSDGALEARWHALTDSLGLGDAVKFELAFDRAGIATAMGRASVFVHPSPRETFGVVAVEALASGTPVVATDSGGVTEIMGPDPEALGALVPVDDPEALASAIVRTLDRRDAFDPATLRSAVERRFGAAFVAEKLLVLYREALGAAAGMGRSVELGAGRRTLPEGQILVVALDRARAASALQPIPVELRQTLSLLTASRPAATVIPSLGSIVEVDVDTAWRLRPPTSSVARSGGLAGRLARLARDPVGSVRRGIGRDAGSEASLAAATQALRAIIAAADGPIAIMPLDGHDHVAAAPVLGEGRVTLRPGGLQQLVDAWHAGGQTRRPPDGA